MTGKRFKFTYVLVLLTFSFSCLSYDNETNNLENFYVKTNYFGALFNAIGSLSGKEDAGDNITGGVFSFNREERIEEGYNPRYVPGFAGSAAIGYLLRNMRIELEGLYSQTDLYGEDYSNKNKARYVELRRNEAASAGAKCNSPWRSGNVDVNLQENCGIEVRFKAAFKMKNEGFNNLAGTINVYHDFNIEETQLTPYVGIGTGVAKVKFLGKTRYALAYQTKLGINYPLTTQTQAFAGLRYFGILCNQFKNIVPVVKIPVGEKYKTPAPEYKDIDERARVESTTATITNRFGIYGLEFGLVYYF
ncbi:MAG: P44/Msp2 family outer membrane protein [Wolbachia sp.]|nr:P44/Msp2 family outer membrane protein [Wolbachia sp.]MDD9336159.1 P44/Msp2 family outer membrane protein [Wolbachia sp.]